MKSVELLSQIIQEIDTAYAGFTADFYGNRQAPFQRNLKKLSVDDAIENQQFLGLLIPSYINALNESSFVDNLSSKQFDKAMNFQVRVKSLETAREKVYHNCGRHMYIAKILNDLFGARLIMSDLEMSKGPIVNFLQKAQNNHVISRYYERHDGSYHAIHCYFQHQNSTFPWELQLWDEQFKSQNFEEHTRHERERDY